MNLEFQALDQRRPGFGGISAEPGTTHWHQQRHRGDIGAVESASNVGDGGTLANWSGDALSA